MVYDSQVKIGVYKTYKFLVGIYKNYCLDENLGLDPTATQDPEMKLQAFTGVCF